MEINEIVEKAPETEKKPPDENQVLVNRWFEEVKHIPDRRERCEALTKRLNGFLSLEEIDPTLFAQQLERGLNVDTLFQRCTDKCGILDTSEEAQNIKEEVLEGMEPDEGFGSSQFDEYEGEQPASPSDIDDLEE